MKERKEDAETEIQRDVAGTVADPWQLAFSRSFKKRGMIALGTYLKKYKVGDMVDVVANGAVQKGMVR